MCVSHKGGSDLTTYVIKCMIRSTCMDSFVDWSNKYSYELVFVPEYSWFIVRKSLQHQVNQYNVCIYTVGQTGKAYYTELLLKSDITV